MNSKRSSSHIIAIHQTSLEGLIYLFLYTKLITGKYWYINQNSTKDILNDVIGLEYQNSKINSNYKISILKQNKQNIFVKSTRL